MGLWKFFWAVLCRLEPIFDKRAIKIGRSKMFKMFATVMTAFVIQCGRWSPSLAVRSLYLKESRYSAVCRFFDSPFDASRLSSEMARVLAGMGMAHMVNGRVVIIADESINPMEARKQPGVHYEHQESSSNSKRTKVWAQRYGVVAVLCGDPGNLSAVIVDAGIVRGLDALDEWEGQESEPDTVLSARMAVQAAKAIGEPAYLLADRAYLTVAVLDVIAEAKADGTDIEIITRAKSNCAAYQYPEPQPKGKPGPKPKKGGHVKLWDLFPEGELEPTSHHLLWNPDSPAPVHFVLCDDGEHGSTAIATTDPGLDARLAVELYFLRSKIEVAIKTAKEPAGMMACRFWSFSQPRLSHKVADRVDPLASVDGSDAREKIFLKAAAQRRFAVCCAVALAIVQMLCSQFGEQVKQAAMFQRTVPEGPIREEAMMDYLGRSYLELLALETDFELMSIIHPQLNSKFGLSLLDVA